MPDIEPLDPDVGLPLLRSSAWHPETIAPMLRHISDWLDDTHQFDAAAHLSVISVTDPTSAGPTTVARLIGEERSTMSRHEQAQRQAAMNTKLEEWRASRAGAD